LKTKFLTWFFTAGKTIPVTHGTGIYQDAIDFAIERLKRNEWVHLYPEGQVNKHHEWLRFYMGIGRMVLENYPKVPTLLPIAHIGMDKVYPPWGPNRYKWSTENPITIIVGDPLDLTSFVEELKVKYTDELDQILAITNHLQDIIYKMRLEVEKVHLERLRELRPDQVEEFEAALVPYYRPKEKTDLFYKIYPDYPRTSETNE